jgi:hypothetical protein
MKPRKNNMTTIAEITTKGQTTNPMDIEYLRAVEGTLSEWVGEADEEAYRELCLESAHDAG